MKKYHANKVAGAAPENMPIDIEKLLATTQKLEQETGASISLFDAKMVFDWHI